jgi:HEAT repeat protein
VSDLESERPTRRQGGSRTGVPRSRLAARVERLLTAALGGDAHVILDIKAPELLADAGSVAPAISGVLEGAGPGLALQLRLSQTLRSAGLVGDLLNALANPDPNVRIAAARLCGALRMTDSLPWLADMMADSRPRVWEAAVRALGQLGGGRAVDALMSGVDRIPQHRLAIEVARAASDMDIEALMREPASVQAAVVTVLACGLRHDTLRVGPLSAIAQDRRWPSRVRVAACRSLGMIGDATTSVALARLTSDPDAGVRGAALDAQRRLTTTAKGGRA